MSLNKELKNKIKDFLVKVLTIIHRKRFRILLIEFIDFKCVLDYLSEKLKRKMKDKTQEQMT